MTVAENWESRKALLDGENKNISNVAMGYVSNLLSLYVFNRHHGDYTTLNTGHQDWTSEKIPGSLRHS